MTDNALKEIQEKLIDKLEKVGGIYAPNIKTHDVEKRTARNKKFFVATIMGGSIDYNSVIDEILKNINYPIFIFGLHTDIIGNEHMSKELLRGLVFYEKIEVLE